MGQYSDSISLTPSYTKSGANNGPNNLGLSNPSGVAVDSINHRLYVSDSGNHRVLVFNLDSNNHLTTHVPSFVIGQPDFNTSTAQNTQSGLNNPWGIAVDPATNRLFVAEFGSTANRVKIFDVSPGVIANGENASYVLGQTDFSGTFAHNTQSGLNAPTGVAFDPATNRLFVAERKANRIKVFDVSPSTITNGENALNVLGQSDWTSAGAANTQSGLNLPYTITFDPVSNRLFVPQNGASRVSVFDVATSTIANGENALNVLGQPDFTSAAATTTQAGINIAFGAAFDSSTGHLFVSENCKVKVFDAATSTISNGSNALYVLGQSSFTASVCSTSQSGLSGQQRQIAFDPLSQYLYVAENGANKIKIFDASSLSNGQNAVDALGQYVDFSGTVVSYSKGGVNNGPNSIGFSAAIDVAVDPVHHRMYLADNGNNRVLEYDLNSSNMLTDHIPDHVLGQPDFMSNLATSTQSGLNNPYSLALDITGNRLFVTEQSNNRVVVYNVANITDGENADYVLGQPSFTSSAAADSQSGLRTPLGVAFDPNAQRLFVSELNGNRVKVFDVNPATITNGENALNILGQANWTSNGSANSSTGFNWPINLAFDPATNRLFVSELLAARIKIFDVSTSTIANNENALNVIGQSDFSGSAVNASAQAAVIWPRGLVIDSIHNILFVGEQVGNRVKTFDINPLTITNGEPALNVLGQTDFTGTSASSSQSRMSVVGGIAFDPTSSQLYVTEYGSNRVKIFNLADPTVTSSAPVSVTDTSAILKATITDAGGNTPIVRGFLFGTSTLYLASTTPESGSFSVGDFSAAIAGLSPNMAYHYLAFASNAANGTGSSTDAVFVTLPPAPSGLQISNVQRRTLSISAAAFPNDKSGLSGYYFTSLLTGSNSGWQQSNSWQNADFGCGGSYSYTVKYRNSAGIETAPASITQPIVGCGGGRSIIASAPTLQPATFPAQPSSAQPVFPSSTVVAAAPAPSQPNGIFSAPLRLGSAGSGVKILQKFLNDHGFPIAARGPGSPGNETELFGGLTKKALARFQEANAAAILAPAGLKKGTGILGSVTISYINQLISANK